MTAPVGSPDPATSYSSPSLVVPPGFPVRRLATLFTLACGLLVASLAAIVVLERDHAGHVRALASAALGPCDARFGDSAHASPACRADDLAAMRARVREAEARIAARDDIRGNLIPFALAGVLLGGLVTAITALRALRTARRHLAARQAAQDALARLASELEARVKDRTRELLQANGALASELEHRSMMEMELRQAQKLEAMGRLAAGVAHEINTPIQFVNDSLLFVREAMSDLQGLVPRWQGLAAAVIAGSDARAAAEDAVAAADTADADYLLVHLPKAIDRARDGVDRVATIVRSLKDFAHPDAQSMSEVDLNHAIETTLTIARNEYKYVATVETDLAPDLHRVLCHPGDINQVILNIVVNAAHAIGDKVGSSGAMGRIAVRTRNDGEHVCLTITDTGGGIPDAIRDRIFEPFFTTKEPGRGTGQGLAIARQVVVEKHGGSLTFETALGEGTTFHIRLPVEGQRAEPKSRFLARVRDPQAPSGMEAAA